MIYTLKHDVGSIEAGFESAFKAKDKSAQRSFIVAMANAEITQIERTRLIKRAADFFGVGVNDLKRDIKTAKAAARWSGNSRSAERMGASSSVISLQSTPEPSRQSPDISAP